MLEHPDKQVILLPSRSPYNSPDIHRRTGFSNNEIDNLEFGPVGNRHTRYNRGKLCRRTNSTHYCFGDSAINTLAALVVKNVYACQSTLSIAPVNSQIIAVTSGISLLLLTHTAARTGITVTFPPMPIDGQLFTIMLGTTNSITFTAFLGGLGSATPFTSLNPATAPTSNAGGNAVTYLYVAATNSWYRYSRC